MPTITKLRQKTITDSTDTATNILRFLKCDTNPLSETACAGLFNLDILPVEAPIVILGTTVFGSPAPTLPLNHPETLSNLLMDQAPIIHVNDPESTTNGAPSAFLIFTSVLATTPRGVIARPSDLVHAERVWDSSEDAYYDALKACRQRILARQLDSIAAYNDLDLTNP